MILSVFFSFTITKMLGLSSTYSWKFSLLISGKKYNIYVWAIVYLIPWLLWESEERILEWIASLSSKLSFIFPLNEEYMGILSSLITEGSCIYLLGNLIDIALNGWSRIWFYFGFYSLFFCLYASSFSFFNFYRVGSYFTVTICGPSLAIFVI